MTACLFYGPPSSFAVGESVVHPPVGTSLSSASGDITLELVARFQHYNPTPKQTSDHYDTDIYSPKSIIFSSSTDKVYVNSLEGMATVVYDRNALTKKGVIAHRFNSVNAHLFSGQAKSGTWPEFPDDGKTEKPDHFLGKPVEFAETHNGRYVWVPYYRRSFDTNGVLPSAVAVVDTGTDSIVRVISTGPVPKMLAASPDGRWLAVIHWGDNTVGFIDISGDTPDSFRRAELVTVEKRYILKGDEKLNRDSDCGLCLRGAVFTPDSRYLLVGRMKGGGIAVIDVADKSYIGTVYGMKPTPRHLLLSPDGETLYLSSNYSGYVSSYSTGAFIEAALKGVRSLKPLKEVSTGHGTRTISLSPNGSLIFAAVKNESRLKVIDSSTMEIIMEMPTDSYPVGMDVSPDGTQIWVTAQGIDGRGGNSVSAYRIREKFQALPKKE